MGYILSWQITNMQDIGQKHMISPKASFQEVCCLFYTAHWAKASHVAKAKAVRQENLFCLMEKGSEWLLNNNPIYPTFLALVFLSVKWGWENSYLMEQKSWALPLPNCTWILHWLTLDLGYFLLLLGGEMGLPGLELGIEPIRPKPQVCSWMEKN